MSDNREALKHLEAATQALSEDPITRANEIIRGEELSHQEHGLWSHVRKVAGGYWVTASFDPIEMAQGIFRAPDQPHQEWACANLDEVFAVLRGRFESSL